MEKFRNQSHLLILPGRVSHIARLNYGRREEYGCLTINISSKSTRRLKDNRYIWRPDQFFQIGNIQIEMTSLTSGSIHLLNLGIETCNWNEFQEIQFLCPHAAVAIFKICQPIFSLCTQAIRFFT